MTKPEYVVRKVDGRWTLFSPEGTKLAPYPSKSQASVAGHALAGWRATVRVEH